MLWVSRRTTASVLMHCIASAKNTMSESATSGVYKDTGGFIAFLGGNIAFYPNTQNVGTTQVSPFVSNNPTSTSRTRPQVIRQAVPFNASNTNLSARIYGIPPTSGAAGMVGTTGGTLASRGP